MFIKIVISNFAIQVQDLYPYHANYDAKIISISYDDLKNALVVKNWQVNKIARKVEGEEIRLIDAKPLEGKN